MSDTTHSPPDDFARALAESPDGEPIARLAALARDDDADRGLIERLAPHSQSVDIGESLGALLARRDRFDLVLLTRDWLAAADEAIATDAVVRLRDLHARSVLAVHDTRSPLPPERWRALGYVPRSSYESLTLYGFNLYDYKRRPDWLNAKYWANPELWDVYRW